MSVGENKEEKDVEDEVTILKEEQKHLKMAWSKEEDDLLMKHIQENGPKKWNLLLSKGLLKRKAKLCSLRWLNKFQPNFKKGMFSEKEKQLVFDLQSKYGNNWAKTTTYFPGRYVYYVKNYLHFELVL
ncbi:hypothetical protein Ccrd_014593 [Cynara cardunculus var. scolymus]|uniref:Homeodomain-like protein n=1 Tax=Cynara cardunculus var. scolymus TaxID=59895 RepID=A0A118K478_CYNCS|nr:hypothetical protein Ccrd_014593 [Cynara cardunculus var. scolymus]